MIKLTSMSPLFFLASYFALTVLVGSLVAYPIYEVTGFEYTHVLSRAIVVCSFVGLWPLCRVLGFSAADVGFGGFSTNGFIRAWLTGAVLIAPVIGFFMLSGFRILDTREQIQVFSFGVFLLSALVSGALVALAEEVLFRGVVPEVIRRAFGASSVFLAGCLSSLAYACIHVLAAPVGVDVDVTPWSGLGVVLASTAPLGTPSDYWDSFSALFLLGLGLCIVRYATGSLMWCLGLHAAFVTSIRVFKELTLRDSFNDYAYLAGGSDHFIGILVAGWLLMLIAAAGVYLSRGQIRSLRPTPLLSRRSDVT